MNYLLRLSQFIESRFANHSKERIYITSFPKAGRTWLKVMLSQYLCLRYNISTENSLLIESFYKKNKEIPYIKFIHDDTPFWKKPSELEHSKKNFESSKLILLIRDPRDMIVSGFFQKSRRHKLRSEEERIKKKKPVYTKSLKDYVYEEVGGIDSLIKFYNIWWDQNTEPQDFKLIKYEDLMHSTLSEVKSILDFIGIEEVDTELLNKVIEDASFDNLKQLEKDRVFKAIELIPLDADDPESFKVRRGKIGGYVDYLEQPEIDYLNEKIRHNLNPAFGY